MKNFGKQIIAATVLTVLGGAALQASAESMTMVTADKLGTAIEKTVNIADLNISSPEGQDALYSRISRAAKQVCGPSNRRDAGSLRMARRNRDCYEDALSRALSEVNKSAVAAAN